MSDETYNGWSNRETWAWMLHVNNDQGIQSWVHGMVEQAMDGAEYPTVAVEDAIRYWTDEMFSSDYWRDDFDADVPAWADLMRSDVGSTWRINWRECARHLIEDVTEDES